LKVLFVGEKPSGSAPSWTLSKALSEHGVQSTFSGRSEVYDSSKWLKLVRASDLLILVSYGGPDLFCLRQLAIAVALGRPVIRYWVGTDVLICCQDASSRQAAKILTSFTSENLAVAFHLAEELLSCGIKAKVIPAVLSFQKLKLDDRPKSIEKRILIYVPNHRKEFFGGSTVEKVIQTNPDMEFIMVGDREQKWLAELPNVQNLGWAEDMNHVYSKVGCLLRITEHDGLPRMILEALGRGKYVIYNRFFPSCWQAVTLDEIQEKIDLFKNKTSLNYEGIEEVDRLFQDDPILAFVSLITSARHQGMIKRRLMGIIVTIWISLLLKSKVFESKILSLCSIFKRLQ
jgi:hypothetical protein